MAGDTVTMADRQQRLEQAIGDYLEAADAGRAPEPGAWLARYPELQPELGQFLADQARIDGLVGPLRLAVADDEGDTTRSLNGSADPAETQGSSPDRSRPAGETTERPPGPEPPEPPPPPPGDGDADGADLPRGARVRYFGDYELKRVLGRGGMGVVYKARQLSLNRPVALKMIRAGVLADDAELRRFQNEAEAVAQLDHPGIVPIHEVGEHDGQRYFSMKLVAGESLADRLNRYRDDPRAAAGLVAEAAEAVHHAHQRGILHRDLKPANILVDEAGRPHVTDFGLSKRVEGDSELTQSGAIMGTPAYMAPEQTTGRRGAVTTATDVYGLGAVLYALLAGRAPFGGESVVETLDAVRTRPPEPPSRSNAELSRDLEVICLKCLEKDPRRRYGSAQALAEDLRRYLVGEPIVARPVGAAERAWMWCRRNKGIAALAALLVASLVAGTVFSLAFAVRARAESRRATSATGLATEEATRANQQAEEARRQRDWSERLRYIAEINLAQRDWDAGYAGLARNRLADLAPKQPGGLDLRGWEWFYLDAAFQPELRVLHGDQGTVTSVAFAPDGRTLAAAGNDGTVQLWDTVSGLKIVTLRGHQGARGLQGMVSSVAFAPDGKTLASAGHDGTVRTWDTATGRQTATLRGHQSFVESVAFAPDGRTLVSAGDAVRIWDLMTGRETATLRGHQGGIWSTRIHTMALAPDGRTLASGGSDGTVRIWDLATGRETAMLSGHQNTVSSVEFAPDGKTLASAGNDGMVRIWDATSGRETITLPGHQGVVSSVEFAPDGKTLASAGNDGTVRIWDATSGRETSILRGHGHEFWSSYRTRCVAFAPDGRRLASAGWGDGTVRIWDLATDRDKYTLQGHEGSVSSMAFAPDGRTLVSAGDAVRIWDTASGRETSTFRGHHGVVAWAFAPDGRNLASGGSDGTVRIWDLATGRETTTLSGHQGRVDSLAFTPDGRALAARGENGTVQIWDLASRRVMATLRGHQGSVTCMAFAPDGRSLASGAWGDGTVRIWDLATDRETATLPGHQSGIVSMAFAPDGRSLATTGDGNSVRIWDLATGRETVTLRGHAWSMVFAPDGRRLASTGREGTVRIWDLATGRETVTLRGRQGGVLAMAFAPDGQTLAAAGNDWTMQLWYAAPLSPQRRVHREALGLVRFLLERAASAADLRDRIRRDPTVSEEVRARALELADGHWEARLRDQAEKRAADLVAALFADAPLRDEVEAALRARTGLDPQVRAIALEMARTRSIAGQLNLASWMVVREPGRDPAAYRLALRRAEAACGDVPDDHACLHTLGVAQYRLGLYREALASLTRSHALDKLDPLIGDQSPPDLAFRAMAQQSLGQGEQARRTLAQLRAAVKSPPEFDDPAEDAAFLREAEALIELDPAFPADPFAP